MTKKFLARAILFGVPLASLVLLSGYAWLNASSRFLLPVPPAEWILYPVPPRTYTLGVLEQHSSFRRHFELPSEPVSARLRVRAFKDCTVKVNGLAVELPSVEHWNEARSADVAALLHPGKNEIFAVAVCDTGTPALWLALAGDGWSIVSDERWTSSLDGATEKAAILAGKALPLRSGHPCAGGPAILSGLRWSWPALLLFVLVTLGGWCLIYLAVKRNVTLRLLGMELSPLSLGLLTASLLWIVLFSHNALSVPPFVTGFDASWHLKYILYIQAHSYNSLPLADEGWEMHQPPLYYFLAAGLLGLCRLSAQDPVTLVILRFLGLAFGLCELVLIAACLKLLFPEQTRRQLFGLAIAAFLPVHLYLFQFVTNEGLLTLLATASLYSALRVLRNPRSSFSSCALLGICLGASLLTKVTGLVIAGTVALVLAGQLVARMELRPAVWLRRLGVPLFIAAIVCGWHYLRVWARFGTPLVGNYDAISSYHYWMDPGHGTLAFLTRFGRSLRAPFYSGFASLGDGLYSTAFGDGLCGGSATWIGRLPWNYDLMATGYLLGLLPSVAIVIGLGWALIKLYQEPRSSYFLLLGVLGGLATATIFHVLRYPYYGHCKAFYETSASLPLCALGAVGLDLLARPSRGMRMLLVVLLGTWAGTAYASFWIRSDGATAQYWAGLNYLDVRRYDLAEECFRKAVESDPHDVQARFHLATLIGLRGRTQQAERLYAEVLRDDPDHSDTLIAKSALLQNEGKTSEALELLAHACKAAPDNQAAHEALGSLLFRLNRLDASITAFREALRVNPVSAPSDHANLGLLLARSGHMEEAVAQYRQAIRFGADQPLWLAHLAWILATQEQGRFRNPTEALRLAQEASRRTWNQSGACLQALAAAQAAQRRFEGALETARHAAQVAGASGEMDLLPVLKSQIDHYEQKRLYFASAPDQREPYRTEYPPPNLKSEGP
jgi:Tfp pilus assembly protein PilF